MKHVYVLSYLINTYMPAISIILYNTNPTLTEKFFNKQILFQTTKSKAPGTFTKFYFFSSRLFLPVP